VSVGRTLLSDKMLVRALRVLLGLSFQLHVQIHIAAARLVVDGELVDADCEMAVEKQRHTISDAAAILFSMLNFPSGGDSVGNGVPRERSPEKP
jgi:hypothetical protein